MEVQQLYIWYYHAILPNGIPNSDNILLFDCYDSVKDKFHSTSEWRKVDFTPMDFPPAENKYKFPDRLYLVLKKKMKNISFDYCEFGSNVKLVSDDFYRFLLDNGVDSGFEVAAVDIVNKKNERMTDRKYYALRFGDFDDELFDFSEKTKLRGKHSFGGSYITFPDLKLQDSNTTKNVFVLKSPAYNNGIIFKATLIDRVLHDFYSPEIYRLSDFPIIYANQNNEELLPLDSKYKVKI